MKRWRMMGPPVAVAAIIAGNAAIVVALWLQNGLADVRDFPSGLVSAGRLTGLLGAYLALVQLALLSRLPALERAAALDRRVAWHRPAAIGCIGLLCAHAVLITAGYAVGDRIGLPAEIGRLLTGYPGVITAVAALAILVAVTATSARRLRRRLRYETWHFTHLYAYLAVALAYSHQIATGSDFVGNPAARVYWTCLYLVTAAIVLAGRVAIPLARAFRFRLRVVRVLDEGPTATSIELGGRRLDRLAVRSGQFFSWRFLTRADWWEAHPFSLSAAPDGQRLRITVKRLGDFSARVRSIRPGTRVIAEGPFGAFTSASRRRRRAALIAGGVGITPIRALLEDMPGAPGDIAVVYRSASAADVILRDELNELATRRGAEIHYLIGEPRAPSGDDLRTLVPDIAERDVYVCGPPEMTQATRATLRGYGVPARQITTERFSL
ncbi:MAG: ferric reductase-like transmembrane domain-containing protein [Solirubrobacterales bacterium]|nr:ferric reductase-like transmembrane domain-containing protein [Solirubrobacterales bacterium]